jgi:protein-disulfide isomerase
MTGHLRSRFPEDRMPSGWVSRVESIVLVGCAVALTGMLGYRQLFPKAATAASPPVRTVSGWRSFGAAGHRSGPAGAAVTIVEFSDFQCPFCAGFETSVRDVLARHPRDVALVYRHFPLQLAHPQAMPAAIAAECAAEQMPFDTVRRTWFDHQAAIGLWTWTQFAQTAGAADTTRFVRCMSDRRAAARVEDDIRAATTLGVAGTPSILINDLFLDGAPPPAQLEEYVTRALRRATPN